MQDVTITATVEKGDFAGRSATVSAQKPDSMDECIGLFGGDAVLSNFWSAYVIDAQSIVRSLIKKGLDASEIQKKFSEWKLGVKRAATSASPEALLDSVLASKDEAAKAAFIEKLKAKLGIA